MSDFLDHLLGPVLQTVPLFQPRPTARFESMSGSSSTLERSPAFPASHRREDQGFVVDRADPVATPLQPMTDASHGSEVGNTPSGVHQHKPDATVKSHGDSSTPTLVPSADPSSLQTRLVNRRSSSRQDALPNLADRRPEQASLDTTPFLRKESPPMSQRKSPREVSVAISAVEPDPGPVKTSENIEFQNAALQRTIQGTPGVWSKPTGDHGATSHSPVAGDLITPASLTHEPKTSPDPDGGSSTLAPAAPATINAVAQFAKPESVVNDRTIAPWTPPARPILDTSIVKAIVAPNDSSKDATVRSAAPPTVRVTIGRVEVRAATPVKTSAHRPVSRVSVPHRPAMSLTDYLARRRGGGAGAAPRW